MQVIFSPWVGRTDLAVWEAAPFSKDVELGPGPRDNRDSYIRWVGEEPPGPPTPNGVHRRLEAAILRYDIFPSWMVDRVLRREPLETGDTVGIKYHPVPGLVLFFGARVVERFDERVGDVWRSGFTYRTLAGHPETGDETFSVEKVMPTGRIRVALRSWSRPGIVLSKLGYPITRLVQKAASRAALNHLQDIARSSPVVASRATL